jgi:hypothetical protein
MSISIPLQTGSSNSTPILEFVVTDGGSQWDKPAQGEEGAGYLPRSAERKGGPGSVPCPSASTTHYLNYTLPQPTAEKCSCGLSATDISSCACPQHVAFEHHGTVANQMSFFNPAGGCSCMIPVFVQVGTTPSLRLAPTRCATAASQQCLLTAPRQ